MSEQTLPSIINQISKLTTLTYRNGVNLNSTVAMNFDTEYIAPINLDYILPKFLCIVSLGTIMSVASCVMNQSVSKTFSVELPL